MIIAEKGHMQTSSASPSKAANGDLRMVSGAGSSPL